MSKQTAVDFLVNKLKSQGLLIGEPSNLVSVKQAKEMEKQQIMESYKDSTCQFSVDSRIDCPKSAEQYYNETFNK